jgi:type I restriction enzyme M protein
MLTSEIKQKIDSARNILVGKIPTPTGQVEQITLALVYKFMNDIDEQNKELGGTLKFFTGEYSKYAWKNLMDKSLSAYERVTAYGEGLEKMHLNPNLPQFFRNVFRGAFLPFRDPEVLTIFLKQIDEFRYGVNGDLGDAFEYLLQVMGTQGDAGQFLTPRHHINFIVSVVDPQKTDKTLDPAEGTAGFLISSYLHILKQNTKPGSDLPGSALTYNERKKLSENFVGYDISHDMVRLSLVNLYLHGFADPRIYEYDTLGNVDRWDDDFDCIVTNPPFMTPRGGVKPHKRFSIQAKRSEVLFVDYIMEHLNPNGKAGIIVPEGIIFKSDTAYKALRKMMIDQNFLYAVVSLPAGIFQPYSGVKTSILFMDRVIAKKNKDILFVKIENDGFDLGAQRRPIDKNDLPKVTEILQRYKMSIQTGKPFELSEEDKQMTSLIPIEKIAKSGDYNLSGDRYRESISLVNQKWPMVELGKICQIERGASPRPIDQYVTVDSSGVNWVKIGDTKNTEKYIYKTAEKITLEGAAKSRKVNVGDFVLSNSMSFGRPYIMQIEGYIHDGWLRLSLDNSRIEKIFMYYILGSDGVIDQFERAAIGGVVRNLNSELVRAVKIPLPPLEVQQKIILQLDSYQKIIDGAKQVIDNYKPEIKIDPDWEMLELGEIARTEYGFTDSAKDIGDARFIRITDIDDDGRLRNNDVKYINLTKDSEPYLLSKEDILIARTGATYGKVLYFDNQIQSVFASYLIRLNFDKKRIISKYFWVFSRSDNYWNQAKALVTGGGQPQFNANVITQIGIPLPPLDIQKQIVSRIEAEQQLVDANKKLIEIYQGKIKEKIDEVWGN